jgi:site-specific recombinase XerD
MPALTTISLAALIQTFFRQHLIAVRGVSPHTLHAYRDAIRGLLKFAATRHQCSVVELALDHIGRDTVLAFLDHLEQQRGNAAVTRNARLAAIHSLYRFMAAEDPAALGVCHQVVAIPFKRVSARTITCPPRTDIEHLLTTIDRSSILGSQPCGSKRQRKFAYLAKVGRSACAPSGRKLLSCCVRCSRIERCH